jgi:[ribosomal protein S5]-alanine N-acetyltransferase
MKERGTKNLSLNLVLHSYNLNKGESFMEIKSERLILKELREEDLDFIYKMSKEPLVYYYEDDEEPSKEETIKKYSKRIATMKEEPHQYLIFLIHILPEEIPIGVVFVQLNWEEMREWEIGYEVHPDYWGNGYATEAVKLLLKHSFEKLNAHKVVGFCNANNKKSANVMERVGMQRDGILREGRLWQGKWCDEYVYSILEREHFSLSKFK